MVIASCIMGALIVSILSYIIVLAIGKNRKLDILMKKLIIYEITVLVVSFVIGLASVKNNDVVGMALLYLILGMMSAVAYVDLKYHFISNRVLLIFLIIWFAVIGIEIIMETEYGMALLFQGLLGAIVGGMIFLLCYLLSRGQLGAGDVKLVFVMGLYLTGDRIIGAIFYGVIISLAYSIVMLIRKKIGIKDGVPLAPFLYIGTAITYILVS